MNYCGGGGGGGLKAHNVINQKKKERSFIAPQIICVIKRLFM